MCEEKFTERRSLKKHIREVHEDKKEEIFKCDDCGKVFSSKGNLTTHQKIHSGMN